MHSNATAPATPALAQPASRTGGCQVSSAGVDAMRVLPCLDHAQKNRFLWVFVQKTSCSLWEMLLSNTTTRLPSRFQPLSGALANVMRSRPCEASRSQSAAQWFGFLSAGICASFAGWFRADPGAPQRLERSQPGASHDSHKKTGNHISYDHDGSS